MWIKLTYNKETDDFVIEGSLEHHRPAKQVTGYEASKILRMFEQELMYEIEAQKRSQRKSLL